MKIEPLDAWILSTLVTAVGGVTAAFTAIYQMKQGRKQRERELRWNQAKLARDMVREILARPKVANALQMLDWEGMEFEFEPAPGEKVTDKRVTHAIVAEALRTTETQFVGKEKFIRDCFDAFFDSLSELEHFIGVDLIGFEDVRFPFEYFVGRMGANPAVFGAFMSVYGFERAGRFVERFPAWKGS